MKKKNRIWIYPLNIMGILLLFSSISFNSTAQVSAGTVKDIDGNVYKTVKIGTQTWMKENLKTTKYNDGTAIPLVTGNTAWEALTTPAYCYYKNDATANKNTYGALYNWYTVNTNKLCPKGWHVPTYEEWSTLITYLGGLDIAGGKLKETGTTHFKSPNIGATNKSGFTALPGGIRKSDGPFNFIGDYCNLWSSTETSSTYNAYHIYMCRQNIEIILDVWPKPYGESVRCIKDINMLLIK